MNLCRNGAGESREGLIKDKILQFGSIRLVGCFRTVSSPYLQFSTVHFAIDLYIEHIEVLSAKRHVGDAPSPGSAPDRHHR